MNGYYTRYFTHPLEALKAAHLDKPDLLISDVSMPDLSIFPGSTSTIQIRAQDPDCKVLLFSGQASTMDLLESARSQGHDFHLILKPVHPTELLAAIGTLQSQALSEVRTTIADVPKEQNCQI
jgi:DNA-binding response OmpR family regulator